MRLIQLVILVFIASTAFAEQYEYSQEEILKAVINAKSSRGNLKPTTLEKRYQKILSETQSFQDRSNFGGIRAYLSTEQAIKILDTKRRAHYIRDLHSTYEYGLVINSDAITETRSGQVRFPNTFFREQMIVRTIADNKVVISAYNGKSTVEFLLDYSEAMEKGKEGKPKITLTHMSDFIFKDTKLKSISNLSLEPVLIQLDFDSNKMQWNYKHGWRIPSNGELVSDSEEVKKRLGRQLHPSLKCSKAI
jgi:hypothetical protein